MSKSVGVDNNFLTVGICWRLIANLPCLREVFIFVFYITFKIPFTVSLIMRHMMESGTLKLNSSRSVFYLSKIQGMDSNCYDSFPHICYGSWVLNGYYFHLPKFCSDLQHMIHLVKSSLIFSIFLRQKVDMPTPSFYQVERRFHSWESNR